MDTCRYCSRPLAPKRLGRPPITCRRRKCQRLARLAALHRFREKAKVA